MIPRTGTARMKKLASLWLVLLTALQPFGVLQLWAAAPGEIFYRGQLTGNSAPFTGTKNVTFGIWDAETGGTALFTEAHSNVPFTNGVFSLRIGSATTGGIPKSALQSGTERWLDIQVSGETSSARVKLV